MIGTIWTKSVWFTFLVIEKNDPKDYYTEPDDRYTVLRANGRIEHGVYISDEKSMIGDNWIKLL